jgi:hypothetical protein
MKEKELRYLYWDERELRIWYDNQPEEIQMNLEAEYQSMVPDFMDYLRRKRYELSTANKRRRA